MKNSKKNCTKPACDSAKADAFDYSGLSPDFASFSKPAQRALLNHGIKTPADLAKWNVGDVMKLHGIGPASKPKLLAAMKKAGKSK